METPHYNASGSPLDDHPPAQQPVAVTPSTTKDDAVTIGMPRAFKVALLALLVLLGCLGAGYAMTSYDAVSALTGVAGFVGFVATILMGVGIGEVTWKSFKRALDTPEGAVVLPLNDTLKYGIALMLIGAPLLFLFGIGSLLILIGFILVAVGAKRMELHSTAKSTPGAAKYIVTTLMVLIGGLATAALAIIIYFILGLRACELSGSSKCL